MSNLMRFFSIVLLIFIAVLTIQILPIIKLYNRRRSDTVDAESSKKRDVLLAVSIIAAILISALIAVGSAAMYFLFLVYVLGGLRAGH